jgi:hypothetical protein
LAAAVRLTADHCISQISKELVVDYSALKKRGPRQAHKLSDEVMGFVEKTKDEGHGTEAVKRLIEDRFRVRVHRRSIERALERRKKK